MTEQVQHIIIGFVIENILTENISHWLCSWIINEYVLERGIQESACQ